MLIVLPNRFRNSSDVIITAHNRRVGQRSGVCGRTKNANKNVEAKRSRNRGDPIFPRFRRQQKCGDTKQQPAAKVKETKIVRDNERDSKYGRSDNDTDPECDESYLSSSCDVPCIESIGSLFRFDAAAPRSGFTQNVESVLRFLRRRESGGLCDRFAIQS